MSEMSRQEDGPVYYREIQKNAYLKRVDNNKVKHLSHKRAPPKAMWTQFCVHNGRTPYLEQYPEPESPSTLAHRPTWRVNLKTARHVTASVRPWPGDEFDFLVATEEGAVRMLAPDWDSMQDWVMTLRNKLHELKVLGRGENVYCAPPAPPPPRAGTRDPTSPLPPTPAGPAIRVPGIELATTSSATSRVTPNIPEDAHSETSRLSEHSEPTEPISVPETVEQVNQSTEHESLNVGINPEPTATTSSDHSEHNSSEQSERCKNASERSKNIPTDPNRNTSSSESTERVKNNSSGQTERSKNASERSKNIAKICGQNVCLDDSILKRVDGMKEDSDEEFFAEIDRNRKEGGYLVDEAFVVENDEETVRFDERIDSYTKVDLSRKLLKAESFKQRMLVSGDTSAEDTPGTSAGAPVSEEIAKTQTGTNITVIQVSNSRGPPHTAIPVLGSEVDVFDFEFTQKLSITSNDQSTAKTDQTFVNIVNTEENVHIQNGDHDYGTIFGKDDSAYGHIGLTTTVKLTGDSIYERLCMASTSDDVMKSPSARKKFRDNLEKFNITNGRKSSLPNLETEANNQNPTYEYLFLNKSNINVVKRDSKVCNLPGPTVNNVTVQPNISKNLQKISKVTTTTAKPSINITTAIRPNVTTSQSTVTANQPNVTTNQPIVPTSRSNVANSQSTAALNRQNVTTTQSIVTIQSVAVNSQSNVSNRSVERSHSQNACDANARLLSERTRNRRGQNQSPRRDAATDKTPLDPKPPRGLFKRGLTELSFLSRLKGLGQNGKQTREAPIQRVDSEPSRVAQSPTKVVRRSRPDTRPSDGARRRSSSLSGDAGAMELQTLRRRQAAGLRAEQARGAAHAARLSRADLKREPPVFCDAHGVVWVASWGRSGAWLGGRAGDRVVALNGVRPRDAGHARQILRQAMSSVVPHTVDVLFHRVPHGKIYVLNKLREEEHIGIKLDGECGIVHVESGSPAARAGIPPSGPRWAVTEINNAAIDLLKGGEDDMNRLCSRGTEASVLIQPLALVQKLRSALKTHRLLVSVPGLSSQMRT